MKTCIFDLDGTVLDTIGDIKAAINYALMTHHIKEGTTDDIMRYVGNGLRNAIERAINEKAARDVPTAERDEIFALMMRYYESNPAVWTRPYDGIVDYLMELQGRGVKLAILSNKAHEITYPLTKVFFPEVRFLFVQGKKANTPLKPSAGLTSALMEEYGLKKKDVIFIGDSEVDHETAMNAGCREIIVNYGFRSRRELERSGIRNTVSSVEELKLALNRALI